jgi:hypothetical protein
MKNKIRKIAVALTLIVLVVGATIGVRLKISHDRNVEQSLENLKQCEMAAVKQALDQAIARRKKEVSSTDTLPTKSPEPTATGPLDSTNK